MRALGRAKSEAATGLSPYIRPTVQIIPPPDALHSAEKGQPTTLLTTGFGDERPRVFWRRHGGDKDLPEDTGWHEVDPLKIQSVGGMIDKGVGLSAVIDFGGAGGVAKPGQTVEMAVMDPTSGQVAAGAFVLGGK